MKHLKLSKHIVHCVLAQFVKPDGHHLANGIQDDPLLIFDELLGIRCHIAEQTELFASTTPPVLKDANQVANEI